MVQEEINRAQTAQAVQAVEEIQAGQAIEAGRAGQESSHEAENCSTLKEYVRAKLPEDGILQDLAEFFKMFADPTRAKILSALEIRRLFVGEIADVVGMSVSAVSHQLRILRSARLVKAEKKGKGVLYSLSDDHVTSIVECGLSHVREEDD